MALNINNVTEILEKFKSEIIANTKEVIKKEISELNFKTIIAEQNNKIEELRTQNERLKSDLQKQYYLINNMKRENNLIFYGVNESDNEDGGHVMGKIMDICNEVMKVELKESEINFVRRLGRKSDTKTRPIILSLVSMSKKTSILKNCGKLKNSKIFVNVDLDKESREKHRELSDIRKRLSNTHSVKMAKNGLEVDGKFMSYDSLRAEHSMEAGENRQWQENRKKRKGETLQRQTRKNSSSQPINNSDITTFFRPSGSGEIKKSDQ
ncbi:uncharacterized protein LOC120352350 [Nilaparvata lugens]|uniref:uncharacterized protein LOC120352350 n=1 Tax=Nilaparvata lugens TaxID=108931 RepID=UPI00193D2117|nr:uncharacterized protein LOC120352350 [Nilaparvata lugens]